MASTTTQAWATQTAQKITLPSIPELFNPHFLDVLLPASEKPKPAPTNAPSNPMMDALGSVANRAYTANMAEAYDSTGSATLDAFNNLAQWSFSAEIEKHLSLAWAEDPELTLRLIWNLRSIHDGKSAREPFYRAFGWLYKHHPRTAIANLPKLVAPLCKTKKTKEGEEKSHGYWKDLSNILALATVGQLSGEQQSTFLHAPRQPFVHGKKRVPKTGTPEERIKKGVEFNENHRVKARAIREKKLHEHHSVLENKLRSPKFRALYIAVARLFAEQLVKDVQSAYKLESLPKDASRDEKFALMRQISLAGKWAPTPRLSHDRVTNLSTAIALLIHGERATIMGQCPDFRFPSTLANSVDASNVEQVALLRSFYRRHILTYLRRISCLPEPLMSAGRWKEINYGRVASTCMKNNNEHFFKHDPEGFEKYLISVEEGKKSISGSTLLPHQLVAKAYEFIEASPSHNDKFPALAEAKKKLADMQMRVIDAQWKSLRQKLEESGALDNCLAICDVSGSMGSISERSKSDYTPPVQPAVALSLLVAQLAKPPFSNMFITFSATPQIAKVNPERNLGEQVRDMVGADWGMNTDFKAVFLNLLLPIAIQNKVKQEDMIKRLFVFSDMQFDEACRDEYGSRSNRDWTTNHDLIESEFKKAGYEMPQVVYWNLQGSTTAEVQADREGVAMMSGFSPSMLKNFMGEEEEGEEASTLEKEGWENVEMETDKKDEEFNPINVMKKALNKESFMGLKVID